MSKKKTPILLSFYGLSNGYKNLFFGKLAYAPRQDLSFKNYSWFDNFKTIIALYRTRAIAHQDFTMAFDHGIITGKTDRSGSFWCEVDLHEKQSQLRSITLTNTSQSVLLTENLYPNKIHAVTSPTIVISDLDDTLLHSFISNKIWQIKTLLFTTVEKRKAVVTMKNLIHRFSDLGAEPFYLSNSEQNLYPMLYRFLSLNEFPQGPLFLKQYVRFGKMIVRKLMRKKNPHKAVMLEKIFDLFSDKKFILIGDNTQHDLAIYTEIATKYPGRIRYIIIREVHKRKQATVMANHARKELAEHGIGLHYDTEFPDDLPWVLN